MADHVKDTLPWIEKYRPDKLSDVILDEFVRQQINLFLPDNQEMNLIISGSPGIGKTSTAICIAKEKLGDNFKEGFLEINAADGSVSTVVPVFCKKKMSFEGMKIILLDEADIMTTKSQSDVNSLIKQYKHSTKFIITCNDCSKIIQDLQSECRMIHYKNLSNEQIKQYLEKVCKEEKLTYDKTSIETICTISKGDMRKAINSLQQTAYSYNNTITKSNILKICKVPDPELIKAILNLCGQGRQEKNPPSGAKNEAKSNDEQKDKQLQEAISKIEDLVHDGYYPQDIVTCMLAVLYNYDISPELKIKLSVPLNEKLVNISKGIRTNIQLDALICNLIMIMNP